MKLGKIGHVGIVVKDITAAKEHYSRLMGIKTWYELVYDNGIDLYYHDTKSNCNVTLYFGGHGHTTIELIETKGEDNIYTNFYKKHGEAIHHIQYDVKDLEKAIADAEKEGLSVFQHATFTTGGTKVKYAYVGKTEDGTIYELIESKLPFGAKKMDMPFEFKMGSLTGSYKKVK